MGSGAEGCLIFSLFCITALALSFIALKIDGVLDWTWWGVMAPLLLLSLMLLPLILIFFFCILVYSNNSDLPVRLFWFGLAAFLYCIFAFTVTAKLADPDWSKCATIRATTQRSTHTVTVGIGCSRPSSAGPFCSPPWIHLRSPISNTSGIQDMPTLITSPSRFCSSLFASFFSCFLSCWPCDWKKMLYGTGPTSSRLFGSPIFSAYWSFLPCYN